MTDDLYDNILDKLLKNPKITIEADVLYANTCTTIPENVSNSTSAEETRFGDITTAKHIKDRMKTI